MRVRAMALGYTSIGMEERSVRVSMLDQEEEGKREVGRG